MITRSRRPMTLAEIHEIDRVERGWRRTTVYLFAGLLLCALPCGLNFAVVTDGFAWLAMPGAVAERVGATLAIVTAGVVVALAWLNGQHTFGFSADRADAIVELVEVEASGALQIGESIIFDVGDNQLLHCRGCYLLDAVRHGAFPSTVFTLVRLPRAGVTLRVESHGHPLPSCSIPEARLRGTAVRELADTAVIRGTLASFAEAA